MPIYRNVDVLPVTIVLYDTSTEDDGVGGEIVRAVPLPPVTILPGETADLAQEVHGNVLQLVDTDDPAPEGETP